MMWRCGVGSEILLISSLFTPALFYEVCSFFISCV